MRLGCSTYSFWHFKGETKPLKEYLDKVFSHGFSGIEILMNHFETLEPLYLAEIKRYAFQLGLDIYAISIHNNFVKPQESEREKEIENVKQWIEVAYRLGAKAIRINSGRWGTIESFDELMANRGLEPPLPGYNYDEAFEWVIDSLKKLIPFAADRGVVLALENHWGLTRDAEGVVKIIEGVGSEWVRALMDTGNFIEDTYEQLQKILPYTIMVHAKTYFGGGEWYTLNLDYNKIFTMLREAGFQGWISLEYEGKEDYDSGVKKSFELLSKYIS